MERSEAILRAADVFIDPHRSYKLLLKFPSGPSPAQLKVSVDFSPSNDRNLHTDVDLEESMCEIWD